MDEKKMATAETATTQNSTAKVSNSSDNTKLTEEKVQALIKALDTTEILNVPDEEEPPCLFNINGVEVLPKQSVAVVAAQKKSGKSNFAGLLMASCASSNHQVLNGVVRCNLENVKVLNIDTEQPLRDARRTLRRVMKTIGYDYSEQWNKHNIVSISIKNFDEDNRWVLVELAVKKYKPDLLFVDGIADLIPSVNDEMKSKDLMSYLDYLACTYNCTVVGMLHLNYGSSKIGGWAGTQMNKKFTDCFLLRKNKNGYFTVEHEGRGESAPNLNFKIVCPVGDKIGWWESADEAIPELTKEDSEEVELRELMDRAPLPCSNSNLIIWLKQAKRWGSKSPADKLLKKCKQYGILGSRREGRQSVWFKVNPDEPQETPLPFPDGD